MDLSVIIVSYNAVDFLRLTLKSVFAACNDLAVEVFVVDNNSTDGAPEMVANEFATCNLIANKTNPGFSVANNQAILKSKGKYILILNPDTIVAEDTFVQVISFMEEKEHAGGLGIRMIDGSGGFLPESKRGIPSPWASFSKMSGLSSLFPHSKFFSEYHKGYLHEKDNYPIEILAGSFMLFKKEVLDQVGLLDEDFFMYGEDIDLSYRIIKKGFNNYYFSGSSIVHFKGESTIKDKIYVNRFYKAMIQFASKHFNKSYGIILKLFIYLGVSLAKMVSYLKTNHIFDKGKMTPEQSRILLLNDYLPSDYLMNKLKERYEVKVVMDLNDEQSGTVLFIEDVMTYKQMIETMDVYSDRFAYRFFNTEKQLILGSDLKYDKGQVVTL